MGDHTHPRSRESYLLNLSRGFTFLWQHSALLAFHLIWVVDHMQDLPEHTEQWCVFTPLCQLDPCYNSKPVSEFSQKMLS